MRVNRRKDLFANVSDQDWNDWKWQFRNRITTLEELKEYIPLTKDEDNPEILDKLRMAITPYYLSLIDPHVPTIRSENRQSQPLLNYIDLIVI